MPPDAARIGSPLFLLLMAAKHKPLGMDTLRAAVPGETGQWFRDKAAREGIPLQAVLAPVLNAYARGEITQGFSQQPGTDTRPR